MRGPGNTPGAWGMETGDRRTRRAFGARSARAARAHRSEPGPARRAARRRRKVRLVAPPCAGRRCRPDQARHGHGAVACGARMCRPRRPSKCESIATDRSRRYRAFRTSVRALASSSRRRSPRCSVSRPIGSRSGSATPVTRPARPPTAAGRPPRSRRRRASRPGSFCSNCSARRRWRSTPRRATSSRAAEGSKREASRSAA